MGVRHCKKCGEDNKESILICQVCGNSLKNEVIIGEKDTDKEYHKSGYEVKQFEHIGGWLILLILSIIFIGLWSAVYFIRLNRVIGTYQLEISNSFLLEITYNAAVLILVVISIIFLFRHKKAFKTIAIVVLSLNFLYKAFALIVLSDMGGLFIQDTYQSLYLEKIYTAVFRAFLNCAIWIPYILISKRVKRTFVF